MYFVNTKKSNGVSPGRSAEPSRNPLGERVAQWISQEKLVPGDRVNEQKLADFLGVSRTPVRAALAQFEAQGFMTRRANRGMELVSSPPVAAQGAVMDEDDELIARIARDRRAKVLLEEVSEKYLMEVYDQTRATIKHALVRLSDLGVVERRLGYLWRFIDDVWDASARREAYLFRGTVEPAALLSPSFTLPDTWLADMRRRHEEFLHTPWTEASSVGFFETNAAFHEGLAVASGNRFFGDSIRRLNRLRRLANYDWKHGVERVEVSCREHLAILDAIDTGDRRTASRLMREHLDLASRLRTPR